MQNGRYVKCFNFFSVSVVSFRSLCMIALSMSFMQVKSAVAAKEKLEKTRAEDMERLGKQSRQREDKLTKLLQETETKHSKIIFRDHFLRSITPTTRSRSILIMHVHKRSSTAPYSVLLVPGTKRD